MKVTLKESKECANNRKISGFMCSGCKFQYACGIYDKDCPSCKGKHLNFQDFRVCSESA